MKSIITVGLVGYGMSGRYFHAPIIQSSSGLYLKSVCTTNLDSINLIRSQHSEMNIVSEYTELLSDAAIDLIVIATPNTSHALIAESAIRAGKHVVIEKPFSVTSEEADYLIDLTRHYGTVLSVYHNRRWDSDFKTVVSVVNSGMLGELVECEMHMDRYRNYPKQNAWREKDIPGSGLLYDLGSHLIDQACVIFGNPIKLFADLRMQRKFSSAIDNFELILHFDKLKVTLKAGMLVRAPSPRFVLLGEFGSFSKYGMDPQEDDLIRGLHPNCTTEWGKEPAEQYGTIHTTVNGITINGKIESDTGDYRGFYINVANAINFKENLFVTPQQARNTIKIIECAITSWQTGQLVSLEGLLL